MNDCIVHLDLRGDALLRLAMFYLACILLLSPLPFEIVQLFSGVLEFEWTRRQTFILFIRIIKFF